VDYNCKICGGNDKDSIDFLGSKICKSCVDKISSTDVDDTINYEYYKANIKKMWLDYIAN